MSGPFENAMVRTDRWYNRITAGHDETDGVVQGASQVYPEFGGPPDPLRNFEAETPTSHAGETRTLRSYREIERVLTEELGVAEND